jgi:quercetin 2,3-dioxygenase
MSNTILHAASSRGRANHGWLQSWHSFSFADYHNPERVHFGALRVLNDDTVAPGMGFGTHRHDNMEIISIPLEGDLEHKDSMGNVAVIKNGDVQVMSAGTGIYHSEYNKNKDSLVKFLQIWVFPNKRNVEPRYGQMTLNLADRHNRLQQIISPNPDDEGLWIHQDAWFSMTKLDAGKAVDYTMHKTGQGVYIFVLNGDVKVNGKALQTRDGLGITGTNTVNIASDTDAEVLVMEVPMEL